MGTKPYLLWGPKHPGLSYMIVRPWVDQKLEVKDSVAATPLSPTDDKQTGHVRYQPSILTSFRTVPVPREAKETLSNLFYKVSMILIPNRYTK